MCVAGPWGLSNKSEYDSASDWRFRQQPHQPKLHFSSHHCSSPAKHQYLRICVKSREDKNGAVGQATHLHPSPGPCAGSRVQPPPPFTFCTGETATLVRIFMQKPPLFNSDSLLLRQKILLPNFKWHFKRLNKFAVSIEVYIHIYIYICIHTHIPLQAGLADQYQYNSNVHFPKYSWKKTKHKNPPNIFLLAEARHHVWQRLNQ